jgi:type II secretory pathway predicted ATPase ExeA
MEENPFTPGYGENPPFLAGRAAFVDTVLVALRRGPGRSSFHTVILGPRGTGKTVTMNAIADLFAGEHDGVVMRWTAGSQSLREAVFAATPSLDAALRSRVGRKMSKLDTSVKVSVPGVEATARARASVADAPSTFALLHRLAERASDRHRTVLVVVDEAQQAELSELATLAGVMQQLANGARLPIAVCASGLPDARRRWIEAASSLERQQFTELGHLDPDDSAAAFEIPIQEAGRRIDPLALRLMVKSSNGFPYAIQLIGDRVWELAGGETLTVEDAERGVAAAMGQLREQLYASRLRAMSPSVRAYVHGAAAVEDVVSGAIDSVHVAASLGLTTKQASARRAEAINVHQVLMSDGRGVLRFAHPGFGEWLRDAARAAPRSHRPLIE